MSTLKKPLFVNGMYNREGKNCRADFVREVSNGAQSFKLWTTAEKNVYPNDERDKFYLYVEVNNYLVPLKLTEWNLVNHLGFYPACVELYGTKEERARVWQRSSGDEVNRLQELEEPVILRYGSDPARQADYIHKLLSDHVRYYIAARDNGGTFADFIGAAGYSTALHNAALPLLTVLRGTPCAITSATVAPAAQRYMTLSDRCARL